MTKRSVMGVSVGAPRVTPGAIWIALRYVGFPLLAALVAFDVLVWLVIDAAWGICVGLWCWL
ncbi:MAG: hypothetical protein AAF666_10710 [Pseudomonadota bacterium]